MHTVEELYERYMYVYEIEMREVHTLFGKQLLKELDLLEDLTLEQFENKLKDKRFNDRWGHIPTK
jgi:hypothetical protein